MILLPGAVSSVTVMATHLYHELNNAEEEWEIVKFDENEMY